MRREHLEDTPPGPVRSQGRVARCVIQNWSHVLSAPRRAWNRHGNNGALHGRAVAPGQPVVSYVGYSLKEPWGEPRVVIGIDADEAEYLADFLDRDECAQHLQIPQQQGRRGEAPPETTGEHARSALLGAPVTFSVGRHAPDQARDMAADLAGWATGEFPVQASEQLAGWPPGTPSAGDQPSSGV
jgi:hypothetical protein